MTNRELMQRAIDLSKDSVRQGGGPFGAVKLNTYDLTGCEIFTSCEPCPMCLV